jgi:hypothetical protein
VRRVVALCAPALVLAGVLTGCGGAASSPASSASSPAGTPRVSSASLATPVAGCAPASVPAKFTLDKAHSGELTAHNYSASADVQAALEFDQLKAGARQVYLHHVKNKHSAVDGVASCVSLQFASAPQAARFFGSYQTLRRQAKPLVHEISPRPQVKGLTGTTAYLERQQSFRGYGITSTNVIEVAGLAGRTLDIASLAGAAPSAARTTDLLKAMVGSA